MDDLHNNIAMTYDRENRGVPRLFATYITVFAPLITSTSVIHDNACGPLVVTKEILSISSPDGSHPRISATDISPAMISASEDMIKANNWNTVTAAVMDSQKLSFKDDTFSHSFTNFLVPSQPGAISEIHRTLKPGGTAMLTTWKFHGFVDMMRRCNAIIRPDSEASGLLANRWPAEEALTAEFEKAGFTKQNIQVQSHDEYLEFKSPADLMSLAEGPFGKFITKDWSVAEVQKLPEVVGQVLTRYELETKSLGMVAWVVIAKKT